MNICCRSISFHVKKRFKIMAIVFHICKSVVDKSVKINAFPVDSLFQSQYSHFFLGTCLTHVRSIPS